MFNSFEWRGNWMNKAAGAGIGVVIVLIAITALYMMNQTDESTTQVDLSEEVDLGSEESKSSDTLVDLEEGVKAGGAPP